MFMYLIPILAFIVAGIGIWLLPWKDQELEDTVKALKQARKRLREIGRCLK